ncbi:CxxxxCH/CxxCH domain c-type cytochrome [Geotalea uraniireducens]|uniref:Cytochrome C family protein n=1 Tax=Geotalea uraniireducens (strain Rf4) TaxID=351605 RepID=A5G714_GEOUR|nr:CxxxxCH/CxxCH domain-containing protein [Geotalea uraniireducens]ABQ27582.1 cytochrome C family protein [Geotalea uraniireducens Rf4]
MRAAYGMGYVQRPVLTIFFVLGVLLVASAPVEAASTCSDCHGMPPIDALYRNITTGGFRGSHRTHQPAVALPSNCEICHTGSRTYTEDHMNGVIELSSNIYNSPATATYSKGVFFNQTSVPVMGTCSKVNCHFEAVTTPWASAPLTSPAGCSTCHSAPPGDGNHPSLSGPGKKHGDYYGTGAGSCIKCHADHTAEAKPFAHATSVGKRGLIIVFGAPPNSGGSYSGNVTYPGYLPSRNPLRNGTCSSLYCHSDGIGGAPKTAAVWGSTLPADCSGCHGGNASAATVIASGLHPKHINQTAFLGTNLECARCHSSTVSVGNDRLITGIASHVDGSKTVAFVGGGTYNAGTKTCSATTCHSAGKATAPQPVAPAWTGAAIGCNGCHGASTTTGAPDYANAGAAAVLANSHPKHVTSAADCATCHNGTTSTGAAIAAGSVLHNNGAIDVTFNSAKAGSGATWAAGTKSCSATSCHGGNPVLWGTTAVYCQDCHGNAASASVSDFGATFWNNGAISKFKMTGTGSWADNGHGRPTASGNYPGSGNPPANFTGVASYCEWCHDSTIAHNVSTNPFRLRNLADASWGKNGACMLCHAAGSAGVTVGGASRNASSAGKVGSSHFGAKHTSTLSGGRYCWDCHEPHGTGNANRFMVRSLVAVASDAATGAPTTQSSQSVTFTLSATPTGTDYAKSAAPFNGICNACHTTTNHYTQTSGDGHNAGIRCTSCHSHTGSSTIDAFKPSGGHSFPYTGAAHMSAAGASPFSGCVTSGCHTNGKTTGYPYPPTAGTPPDCQGCHTKAAPKGSPTTGCYSCHGSSTNAGRPIGTTFPDVGGLHTDHHGSIACTSCHGTAGHGQSTHGPSNRTLHNDANVIIQMPSGFTYTRSGKGDGHGTCNGSCGGENHSNYSW